MRSIILSFAMHSTSVLGGIIKTIEKSFLSAFVHILYKGMHTLPNKKPVALNKIEGVGGFFHYKPF